MTNATSATSVHVDLHAYVEYQTFEEDADSTYHRIFTPEDNANSLVVSVVS